RRVLVFRSSAVSSKRSTRTAAISCPARDLDRVARIGRLEVELVLAVGIGRGDAGGKNPPKYVGANGMSASVLVPLGNIPVLRTSMPACRPSSVPKPTVWNTGPVKPL